MAPWKDFLSKAVLYHKPPPKKRFVSNYHHQYDCAATVVTALVINFESRLQFWCLIRKLVYDGEKLHTWGFLHFFTLSSFTDAAYSNNIIGLVVTFVQEGLQGDWANLQTFWFGQFQGCNNDAVSVSLTLQALSDGSTKLRSVWCFWPDWSIKAWQMWAGSILTLMTVVELHLQNGQQLIQSPDMISHWPQQLESCHPQHTVSPWNEHCWLCLSRD